jgi:hypothetical protein
MPGTFDPIPKSGISTEEASESTWAIPGSFRRRRFRAASRDDYRRLHDPVAPLELLRELLREAETVDSRVARAQASVELQHLHPAQGEGFHLPYELVQGRAPTDADAKPVAQVGPQTPRGSHADVSLCLRRVDTRGHHDRVIDAEAGPEVEGEARRVRTLVMDLLNLLTLSSKAGPPVRRRKTIRKTRHQLPSISPMRRPRAMAPAVSALQVIPANSVPPRNALPASSRHGCADSTPPRLRSTVCAQWKPQRANSAYSRQYASRASHGMTRRFSPQSVSAQSAPESPTARMQGRMRRGVLRISRQSSVP